MQHKRYSLLLLGLLFCLLAVAQKGPDPVFTFFKGTAYKIPTRTKIKGYSKGIYNLEKAGEVVIKKIQVPERNYKVPFPGLEFMHRFGIVFKAEMTIAKKGIYAFTLNSDDGSLFWIDDKKVIDNDGEHQMRLKTDTILLEKGIYPVKLWYYQGFPDRYGITFDAFYYKDFVPEEDGKYLDHFMMPKLVFDSAVLPFASSKYQLNAKGMQTIDSLAVQLKDLAIKKIIIHGHTDNVGSADYNQVLSVRRAKSVQTLLATRLKDKQIAFVVEGFGEDDPLAENETVEGRRKNRRVEIEVE